MCSPTGGSIASTLTSMNPIRWDSRPFFEFDVLDFEEHQLAELKKFTKSAFSLDDILATASTLKYAGAVKRILERELENPSETFVRFFAAQVYDGRITQNVLEQFTRHRGRGKNTIHQRTGE